MSQLRLNAVAAPAAPAAGKITVYLDVADGKIKSKTAAGVVTVLGGVLPPFAESDITNLVADLAAIATAFGLKAPLASPALSGTPTAPTAGAGTNTTQLATTAFVLANGGGGAGATRCAAYNSAVQSIADGTFTVVTFDSEDFDVTGVHSAVQPSQFIIPAGQGGTYRVSAVVSFAAHATGQRILKVIRNGADFNGNGYILSSSGGTFITGMSLTVDVVAAAGDSLELHAYQNSGGALNIGGASAFTMNRMQIARIA
jgi:hypothetical protein